MKKQKMYKKLSYLFVFIFVFGLTREVYAADEIQFCKGDNGNEVSMDPMDIAGRYGITFTNTSGNTYVLKMEPTTNTTERCKVEFKVSSVNNNANGTGVGSTLTCSNPVTLNISDTVNDGNDDYGLPYVKVEIKTDTPIIKNENSSASCYYRGATASFSQSAGVGPGGGGGTVDPLPIENPTPAIGQIDCTKSFTEGSFEQKFCNAKNKAIDAGNRHDFGSGKYTGDYITFKCEHKLNGGSNPKVPLDPSTLTGDAYYVNQNYLYGFSTETINMGNYKFHYNPGETTEGAAIKCDIICEESVEVEYGPPVASKAGMCFEYKVRVTSRVSCSVANITEPPPADYNYCTPYPNCVSSNGSVWRQGGPSEQFDSCVKSCDGGKYTKKCSNKCYNEVYANKYDSKVAMAFYDDVVATRLYSGSLADCEAINPNGCYVRSGGAINWTGSGEGRWYTEHPNGKWHNGNYRVFENGFYRHVYSNGNYCHDTCSWLGCSGNVYLNPGMAEKDYEENVEKYNQAIRACSAKATCSTTTSEYTIHADYTKAGDTVVTSINFPYDSQKDTITHTNGGVIDTTGNTNTTLLVNEPATGEGLLGCYKKNETAQNLYRSTWTFPGTWINLKTGEISFVPKSTSASAWTEKKYEFCIPNDAKSVNAAWWNEYQALVIAKKGITSSINDAEISGKCCKPGSICNPPTNAAPDVYNIRGKATKFGFFEWNIEMDCFYAINRIPTGSEDDECVPDDPEDPADPDKAYDIRSVDLNNMFPAKDGSDLSSPSSTGRTPGYNWSTYAENDKNDAYVSKPSDYLTYVQGQGDAIYNDSTLDYEFNLSSQTIRAMRKDTSRGGIGQNYSDFDDSGFFVDSNGVGRYKSSKIRALAGNNRIPNGQALLCNNMENYASSSCHVD